MEIIFLALLLGLTQSQAIPCDKNLNYHESYGYGFDITCNNLTNENKISFTKISAYNEIVLKLNNSNLTKVKSNFFTNLRKLRCIFITNSTFMYEEEQPFINLQNLEHVTIENSTYNDLNANTFQRLEHLKELNLVSNKLRTIKKDTFKVLTNLETLKLSNNYFKTINDVPICELPKLKHFHIDRNQIEILDRNTFFCFQNPSQPNIKVNEQNYSFAYSKHNFFHQMNLTGHLTELNVSYNNISKIEIFDWVFNLKHINLESNRLRIISDKLFSLVDKLEKLNLKNNVIENCSPKAFANLVNLKQINLENNRLSDVYLQQLSSLEEINLSRNKLVSSSFKHISHLPRLKILLLNDNKLTEIPLNFFQNFSLLETLDLSNNNLKLTDYCFKGLISLKQLSIRNNSLEAIPQNTLNNLLNIEVLDFSQNNLEAISDSQTFSGLNKMQTLNISYNKFEYLNYKLLKSLHNLQVLDIAGNRLQNFQFDLISTLPSLRVINIKSNLLSCDILSKIITFLKSKKISYTINEDFEYDKINVEGIYCEQTSSKLTSSRSLPSALGILFIVIFSSGIISLGIYKFLQFSRRRRYFMDEMELIEG